MAATKLLKLFTALLLITFVAASPVFELNAEAGIGKCVAYCQPDYDECRIDHPGPERDWFCHWMMCRNDWVCQNANCNNCLACSFIKPEPVTTDKVVNKVLERSPLDNNCGYACTSDTCSPACPNALPENSVFVPAPVPECAIKIVLPTGATWICAREGCHRVEGQQALALDGAGMCTSMCSGSGSSEICAAVCNLEDEDEVEIEKRDECWEVCDPSGHHCSVVCGSKNPGTCWKDCDPSGRNCKVVCGAAMATEKEKRDECWEVCDPSGQHCSVVCGSKNPGTCWKDCDPSGRNCKVVCG